MLFVEIEPQPKTTLQVSPIMLAKDVRETNQRGRFVRRGAQLFPYPGRSLLYGEELWLYYEISGLQESPYGDRTWEESYFIIPDAPEQGIVRMDPGVPNSTIREEVSRSVALDLSSLEEDYEGSLFVVVLITDGESEERAVSAARFSLSSPAPPDSIADRLHR
jgi:hypothetical protein